MSEGNGAGPTQAERRKAILDMAGVFEERRTTMDTTAGPIDVIVREISGQQSRLFEEAVAKEIDAPLGMLLQWSLVDPETKALIFEPADRAQLEQLGLTRLKPLIVLIKEISGLDESDVEKAKKLLASAPSTT